MTNAEVVRVRRSPAPASPAPSRAPGRVPPPARAANKRKIMRIFSMPPTAETLAEPNFYDTISKIRLRQQLEMYSICKCIPCYLYTEAYLKWIFSVSFTRKYDCQQPQSQTDSVQLSLE
ncbi:small integral membrane protein 19 isoform X2 [Manis pentadactyla]|uniref:small integral membrane protein 19 isoform X2 n=1 Tax=Manis pentadactyla TaxID=143292 RepID=UPI00255CFB43|nr:small integral membrane protein 19 isoform X2 [Manis pentadactyla]